MRADEARLAIAAALRRIAPEADIDSIDPRAELREELDLDSMDFLNLAIEIGSRTSVEVPEDDYDQVATLERFIAYLVKHSVR
jgi:acyl carrier protein